MLLFAGHDHPPVAFKDARSPGRSPWVQDYESPRGPSPSREGNLCSFVAPQLFEELDDAYEQLLHDADRWFVSGGGDTSSILDERRQLKQRCEDIEDELRARHSWNTWPIPNVQFHAHGSLHVHVDQDP